jgi:hypothetical protein
MLNLLLPIILVSASTNTINGVWSLPGENDLELMIGQRNGLVRAILKMDSCKPVYLPFTGSAFRANGKVVVALKSKKIKISDECSMAFILTSSGRIIKNKYITSDAVILSKLDCLNSESLLSADNVNGIWKRRTTFKKRLPKHQCGKKGKKIHI